MKKITDQQIRELQAEACAHGDEMQEIICAIALDGYPQSTDFRGATPAQRGRLGTMTRDDARAECARVINTIDSAWRETMEPTNGEGLTLDEWLAAAGRNDTTSQYDLRAAWRAGEDPTEYRHNRFNQE